jgi:PilZ domain
MSGAIEFAGSTINCLIRNISISGAALDVTNPLDIPERFDLVFKADGTNIPCHVIWRKAEQIGVAFDQHSNRRRSLQKISPAEARLINFHLVPIFSPRRRPKIG